MPQSDSPVPVHGQRPTMLRHMIVVAAMLMSILLYLDRLCVSFAEVFIQEDLQLTTNQMGIFLGAFFWSYALAQVPSGWLSDRYGPRIMLVLYILSWSFFTVWMGMATSFAMLIFTRLAFGLCQSGAYPTSASLLSVWVPLSMRGTASSLVALGGRVGGAIAPILTAQLMLLLVPITHESLLKEKDLLPGKAAILVGRLLPPVKDAPPPAPGEDPPKPDLPALRVWQLLTPVEQQDLLEARPSLPPPPASKDAPIPPEPETFKTVRGPLLQMLNRVITDPALDAGEDFKNVQVAREATALRATRGTRSLSEIEQKRLNRLLLEAAFPKEIGKLYVAGWRPVLYIYGTVGIVVALIFWFVFRNRPEQHPACNEAERALIAKGRTAVVAAKAPPLPILQMLTNGPLWHSSLAQIGTNIGWLFIVTFLARYLKERYEVELVKLAWLVSLPMFAGIAGMLFGGPTTDLLTRKIGRRWGRALPMVVTRFIAAAAYIGCLWAKDAYTATALFCVVAFFCDLGIASLWAYVQDVGGRHAGSILGWGNMWGNFAAAVAPMIYAAILDEDFREIVAQTTGDPWNLIFLVCSLSFVWSGLHAMGIDATRPIIPEEVS